VTRSASDLLRELAEHYSSLLEAALGDRLVSVVLFGSVARGDAGPHSDIDLLIVAHDLPRGQFARKDLLGKADAVFEERLVAAAETGVETRLARILRTPKEAERIVPLYLDLTEDAVLLRDDGGFFAALLERVRASLRRLGARRIWRGRTWSWDLKPDFALGDVIEI